MYKVIVNLLPQNATLNQKWQVLQAVHGDKETILQSADDAVRLVLSGSPGSKVKVWWKDEWSNPITPWLLSRGVQIVEHHPVSPPPPAPNPGARIGLHASADPGDITEAEFQEFATSKAEVVKVLSAHSGPSVAKLASMSHVNSVIVRAFLDFGGRNVTPDDFVNWTADDVLRAVSKTGGKETVLELHNEPNLAPEGLFTSWADGYAFAAWLNAVAVRFRALAPSLKLMYPGLSPGGDVPGLRQSHKTFIEESRNSVNNMDALAVHLYWSESYPMPATLSVLDDYITRFPDKEIWITEASHNMPGVTADHKASQYLQFWQSLKQKPNVRGVTYYVASASNPAFGWQSGSCETWIEDGQSLGIGEIVGQR